MSLLPEPLAPGLTEEYLDEVESRYGFRFAADHREMLAAALPVGPGFPDWRTDSDDLRRRLVAPADGVLFDVEHNAFWYDGWGARPSGDAAARAVAVERLAAAPPLVPVYGHRYLPGTGGGAGHPVLSVHQTDIVVYGADLPRYLRAEFGAGTGADLTAGAVCTVPFWSDLVS
ncbi:hypothetical protein GCM10022220_33240 [Actinocatenispora rupis]|uniref:SMI1/KNR4 family protein n=2 Tax=Actinocatenispora rupis TaxID=519421 RepID=A0A8J3JA26_9ACTN|nr:hypothetical protein Aru02nite_37230 [Actinocatenispora rupis]